MKHKGNTNVIEVFTQYCFLELSSKEALFFFFKANTVQGEYFRLLSLVIFYGSQIC